MFSGTRRFRSATPRHPRAIGWFTPNRAHRRTRSRSPDERYPTGTERIHQTPSMAADGGSAGSADRTVNSRTQTRRRSRCDHGGTACAPPHECERSRANLHRTLSRDFPHIHPMCSYTSDATSHSLRTESAIGTRMPDIVQDRDSTGSHTEQVWARHANNGAASVFTKRQPYSGKTASVALARPPNRHFLC